MSIEIETTNPQLRPVFSHVGEEQLTTIKVVHPRKYQIWEQITLMRNYQAIAAELDISLSTLKKHISGNIGRGEIGYGQTGLADLLQIPSGVDLRQALVSSFLLHHPDWIAPEFNLEGIYNQTPNDHEEMMNVLKYLAYGHLSKTVQTHLHISKSRIFRVMNQLYNLFGIDKDTYEAHNLTPRTALTHCYWQLNDVFTLKT